MKTRASLTVTHTYAREAEPPDPPKAMLDPKALEAFLVARRPSVPVLSIDALDGYLTALLIGPTFVDPRLWLGLLVGDGALMAAENTDDHLALQAIAAHHNRLSDTLSQFPDLYRPLFPPHRSGGLNPMFWTLGFLAGVKPAARAWKRVTDPGKPEYILFEPLDRVLSDPKPIPESTAKVVARTIIDLRAHFQIRRNKPKR